MGQVDCGGKDKDQKEFIFSRSEDSNESRDLKGSDSERKRLRKEATRKGKEAT